MKKYLKILLVLLGVALCLAAFYGYHWHQATSLDNNEIGEGYNDGDAMTALNAFKASLEKYERMTCGPSAKSVYEDREELLTVGSIANIYESRRGKLENTKRIEKEWEMVQVRDKWETGEVTSEYLKKDGGWFNHLKTISVDMADSSIVWQFDENFKDESRIYLGKKKNGVVTECVDCSLSGSACGDTIGVDRVELDSNSGNVLKRYFKSREYYIEGMLTLSPKPFAEVESWSSEMVYDELHRLVEKNENGKVFRFKHGTDDTLNLNVKIYGANGLKLGFYKRLVKRNKEVVHYGTREFEAKEVKYFKDGKLAKSEFRKDEYYREKSYKSKLYNASGNVVKDSSFQEGYLLPGFPYEDAMAFVTNSRYNKKGKIADEEILRYEYSRRFPLALFPRKLVYGPGKFTSYEYLYDAKDRPISVVVTHPSMDYVEQTVYEYGGYGSFWSMTQNYTKCWLSPDEVRQIEWKPGSKVISISNDGRYYGERRWSIADDSLVCKKTISKKPHNESVVRNVFFSGWNRCLQTNPDVVKSVPLKGDTLVKLDETMLSTDIMLESILCENCEIDVRQEMEKINGKWEEIEGSYNVFTCKMGRELYDFIGESISGPGLESVAVFYGDTTGVPNCRVGFKPTNGIALGMSKVDVEKMNLPFEKDKDEWDYSSMYGIDENWTEVNTMLLKFCGSKLCRYQFSRGVWN